MYEQDKDVAGEQRMGVQEAANYLGIHRATLFRALSNGLLIADFKTPKGRSRFRLETIEAFREKLKVQAATSQDHVYAPVRIMAKLASLCSGSSQPANPVAVINETLRLLCPPESDFSMACVAIRVPSDADPYRVDLLAELGIPERLKAAYTCLRPCEEFPLTIAMRTNEPQIWDDICTHPFPQASATRALAQNGIASYAVLPLATGAGAARETFGALVLCGRARHMFSYQERLFLQAVADAMSACIVHGSLLNSIAQSQTAHVLTADMAVDIASKLLETAFAQARCSEMSPPSASPVEFLCNIFAEQSHALATWVYGFPPHACGDTPDASRDGTLHREYRSNLQSLVFRTRTADGLKREQWQSRVTAVALPVPLPSGERGAVGAVWPGIRETVAAEEILLSTLATACSVVSEYR
ncbi:MAG: hypothetical protein ACM3N4_03765 [Nitrososphaerota archaeon]